MEGELKVRHMRYQIAQYEFLIRSVPKTTCFPLKRSFRPNYLIEEKSQRLQIFFFLFAVTSVLMITKQEHLCSYVYNFETN